MSYILTKIAVGIFAGGIVFAALLPDLQLEIAGTVWNSFWIGSVTVIVSDAPLYWNVTVSELMVYVIGSRPV